jgi:phosphohistidine swiveling domain-containing protein
VSKRLRTTIAATPAGCEGWEEMYPYYARFDEARGDLEEGRFWFRDDMHWAEPIYPFDAVVVEFSVVGLSQASARLFAIPSSLGIEYRILNGYGYVSPRSIADPATIEQRAQLFAERGTFYYEHWDELYASWLQRVEGATRELDTLEIPALPELEEMAVVTEGRGWGSSHALLVAYNRMMEGLDRVLQYHFEFLNLGYLAYLAFYEFCRRTFPDTRDQTLSGMVAGIDVVSIRPDEELKRLAGLALELDLGHAIKGAETEDDLRAALGENDAGARWLAQFESTKDPWFYFSYGNGLSSDHRSWIDDTSLPIAMIGSYVARLEAGETISRPRDAVVAERDRLTEDHRARLEGEARRVFDERLALARTVFPFVENHNFYIDHRYLAIFWNKVRELGALLARYGLLQREDDIFYLRHDEVPSAIGELRLWWSTGGGEPVEAHGHWIGIVERRRAIREAMRRWTPPPALGGAPEEVADPVTIMLWGVTDERVRDWLGEAGRFDGRALHGIPASGGVAEGRARVILNPDQLGQLEDGEILITPSTSTSWTPMFGRLAAAVSESGGVMCHAAIMAREYGLPAVVGALTATTTIRTGARIRVDGTAGVVTILD